MKIKSIKINAFLNALNTVLTISFSLITFPYVSRILGVINFGKFNYSNSIASYFILLAGLGINTYAIREGGRLRGHRKELAVFCNQIFTFSFVMALLTYTILAVFLMSWKKGNDYKILIAILSIPTISNWIGVNWINIIFDDYLFITIRSIIVQVISIVCLFIFVHTPNDYITYSIIFVASSLIVSVINYCYILQFTRVRFTKKFDLRKHIKPILVLFSNNLAVTVYVNSDSTMLGLMKGDYDVGIYSVAVKIYTAIKTILAAIYNVAIVRMAQYSAEDNEKCLSQLLNKIINMIIFIATPMSFGLCCCSSEVISLLSGQEYVNGSSALDILAFAFSFAILGGAIANCVAVPLKREGSVLIATSIGAVENIILNLYLIPKYSYIGAAITTLLAEFTVSIILIFRLRDKWALFNWKELIINSVRCIAGSCTFLIIKHLVSAIITNRILYIILMVLFCGACYCATELFLHNRFLFEIINPVLIRFKRKRGGLG